VNESAGANFSPKIFAWNLEMATALAFSDKSEADAFYKASAKIEFDWQDPIGGKKSLRVARDAAFDTRLRNQVYYHLRVGLIALLGTKRKWNKDTMDIGTTGPRGDVFGHGGGEVWEFFKIDIAKRGDGSFLSPVHSNLEKFDVSKSEVEELAASVIAKASLLSKQKKP